MRKNFFKYLLFAFCILHLVACKSHKTVDALIVYKDGMGNSREVRVLNTSDAPVDTKIALYNKAEKSWAFQEINNIDPRSSKFVGYVDTAQNSTRLVEIAPSFNSQSKEKDLYIALIPALLSALVTIIVGAGIAYLVERNKTIISKNRELRLLWYELNSIINHISKNKALLEKLDEKEGVATTLFFKRMKIDSESVLMSVNTARLLKNGQKDLLNELLTLRLRFRNINTDIDHIVEYMDSPSPHMKTYVDLHKMLLRKTDKLSVRSIELQNLINKAINNDDSLNTSASENTVIIYEDASKYIKSTPEKKNPE